MGGERGRKLQGEKGNQVRKNLTLKYEFECTLNDDNWSQSSYKQLLKNSSYNSSNSNIKLLLVSIVKSKIFPMYLQSFNFFAIH